MKNRVASIIVGALAALAALPALAAPGPGDWNHGMGFGWGHMLFGSLMMVLFWGGIIVVVVMAVRWLSHGGSMRTETGSRDRAMEILKERFAKGEIDAEEYEQRKRLLSD